MALGLCLLAVPAMAMPEPPPLTEEVVVRMALARPALAERFEGSVAAAQAQAAVAGALANPEVAYLREELFEGAAPVEERLTVSQLVDLGNRRGLQQEAGERRADAVRRDDEAMRRAIAADARARFYEVLFRKARVAAIGHWITQVDRARSLIARREERGDAAGYDLRRVERERVVAEGWLAFEQAALERAGARLEALLTEEGSGATSRVSGALLPTEGPMSLEALQVALASRPALLARTLDLEASTLEGLAAERWWIPDLRIEAGWRVADRGGQAEADGLALGASVELPLWGAAQSRVRVASGVAQAARGQLARSESELRAELAGLHAASVRLQEAAARFLAQSSAASADLVRMASVGHVGGEFSLLELLDAYRGETDDALRGLEMALAARQARIELEQLTGAALP
jgi:cobalt-zinc-cadmium efflux system outer membrane protein